MIMNNIRTFKYRGLVIDEVESDGSCRGCFFYTPGDTRCSATLECVSLFRKDGKDVIYKKQNNMSKVTIEEEKESSSIKIGDFVINENHLFLVTGIDKTFFDGVVIKSDRFNVGTVRWCVERLTYRRFKGTITIK